MFDFLFAQVNIDSGLVLYMPFDGNILDYSGRKNHGFGEGISYSTGRFGNQASACYISACYRKDNKTIIRIPFSSDFDFSRTKELSAGFWADTNAIEFSNISSLYDCMGCFLFCLGTDETNQNRVWITLRGSHCWLILNSGDKNLQGWHHYFMTLNNKQICLYLDGSIIDSLAAYNLRWRLPNINHLEISKTGLCEGSIMEKGSIDSFRLYNRRLSAKEIQSIYNRRD